MSSWSAHSVVVAVVLGVWCVHLVAGQEFLLCTFTDLTTGKTYDLTNLANIYSTKAAVTDPDANGWRYYISPCQPVRGNALCVGSITSTAVCQQDTAKAYPLGTIVKGTFAPCEGKFKWTSVPAPGGPQPYIWQFEWRTAYACPTGGGGGGGGGGSSDSGGLAGGWIFVICLVSVTVVYFAGGVAVQKFYFKREGLEIVPNSVFWLALPGLVKDGHIFLFNSARRMCGRGYQQI